MISLEHFISDVFGQNDLFDLEIHDGRRFDLSDRPIYFYIIGLLLPLNMLKMM